MLEDQWTAEVKRLNALCDDTLKTIRKCDRARRTGHDDKEFASVIEANLGKLHSDVTVLEQELSKAETNRSLQSDELRRRETAVIDLISFRDRLETLAANKNPRRTEQRSVRFSDTVVTFNGAGSSNAAAKVDDDDTEDTNEQLLDVQRRNMDLQDRHLDALSDVLSRQKRLAGSIGDELDLQSDMLEELDENVQHSHGLINRATKALVRVSEATKKDRLTQLLCVIICIIIVVVFIVLLAKFL